MPIGVQVAHPTPVAVHAESPGYRPATSKLLRLDCELLERLLRLELAEEPLWLCDDRLDQDDRLDDDDRLDRLLPDDGDD
jgi:hypothetical protein